MAVMAALALWEGTEDCAVYSGQVRGARKVFGGAGGEHLAPGGQGSSPCMRVWRRSEASSWPVWVRWK